jgi:Domain of unknown function (DUF4270)
LKPLRKTITTQTRSTTFIQTWWVKTTLLALFLLPLFLVSCEENPLTIGFKKEPKNFQVLYRELPIESVTFLGDSLPTYNNFGTTATNRLLVGTYTDPEFGKISASFYSQIRPSNGLKVPEEGAVYDSVTLKLKLDYYYYGSKGTTTQKYKIYLLREELINEDFYFNRSKVRIGLNPIGETSITVNSLYLDQLVESNGKDTLLLSTILNRTFGKDLFDIWKAGDSTFTDFFKFKVALPGIAVVPEDGGDKVFGFAPATTLSKLVLHYHVDTVKHDYPFYFDNALGFNGLISDRANTALSDLTSPKAEYMPGNGLNYVQSGVGIFSKLSFKSILQLRDSVPKAAFNSVELEIPVTAFEEGVQPPALLALRLLNTDNSFALSNVVLYSQNLVKDANTGGVYVMNDLSSAGVLTFDKEKQVYRGFITQFAQLVFNEKDPEKVFTDFALYPLQPDGTKSVDRFSFDKTQIKLKVYYTKALTGDQSE